MREARNKYRLPITILIIVVVTGLIITGTLLVMKRISDTLYDNTLQVKKETYKDSVENMKKVIDKLRNEYKTNNPDWTEEEIKSHVTASLHEIIYAMDMEDDSYMWVQEVKDYNGGEAYAIRLIHPNMWNTEGAYLSTNTSDNNGHFAYREELEGINKDGSAFLTYAFKEMNSDNVSLKVTYSSLYKDYNWIISRGVSLNEIDSNVARVLKKNQPLIIGVFVIYAIGILIILGYAIALNNKTSKLKEAEAKLKNEVKVSNAANDAKTSFLFNMSHDIRTPMNAVIGFTDLAMKDIDNVDKVKDYLSKVKVSSEYMLSILNDVLEMARIESGKLNIEEAPMNLNEDTDNIRTMVGDSAKEHGLTIEFKNVSLEHDNVYGDELRLLQISMNLLSNAIKYTREGGHITRTLTEVPCNKEGYAMYHMIVEDDGIGMTPEFLEHIFDMFERKRTEETIGTQGTGLGMTITKRLVEAMGGNINIESELNKGTKVTVVMPLRISQQKRQRIEHSQTSFDLTGKKVLLVEDNELNREIAADIIENNGLEVDTAEDGSIAVNMILDNPAGTYDFVLMDIQMPYMDGYKATEVIRGLTDKKKANIPIIAMTANAFTEDKQRALVAGMNAHVAKPIDIDVLWEVVGNVLQYQLYHIDGKELKEFEDKYKELHCPYGYLVYSAEDDRILYADDTLVTIFGCKSREEFIDHVGGTFTGVVHPDDYDEVKDEIDKQQKSSSKGLDYISYRIIRKDGFERNVDDVGYKVFNGKELVYYVFIADVTDAPKGGFF